MIQEHRQRLLQKALRAALIAACVVSLAPRLHARQEYYDAVTAGTDTCHDCRLCHTTVIGNATSYDTTKPFFMSWAANGGLMPHAIDPAVDSDGDGFTDFAEVSSMPPGEGDPNDPLVGPGQYECPTGPSPEFGCARVAPRDPDVDGVALLASALVLGLMLLRRR